MWGSKMRFIVLGGYGIIGRAVISDLFKFEKDSEIIISGRNLEKARELAKSFNSKRVKAIKVDINNQNNLINSLKKIDVCINCVQYYFNLEIMRACIKAKTNYVDLGGMFHYTKKQLRLNNEFKKIGKTAILGAGSAPGISNILVAYGSNFIDKVDTLEIVFADKDYTKYSQIFVLPYSFKTLIDEYTLNPAVFKDGKLNFVKPRSEIKEYDFPNDFGKQKGFLTLHSEIATLPKYLKNKGINNCEFRVTFPEDFSKKILILIKLGFTSKEEIDFSGKKLKTVDITSSIMDRLIPYSSKINDKEIIRVIFDNKLMVDALTFSDGKTSAGVLNTAISCSIISQMLAKGNLKSGVYPPEMVINTDSFFRELNKRKIIVLKNNKRI